MGRGGLGRWEEARVPDGRQSPSLAPCGHAHQAHRETGREQAGTGRTGLSQAEKRQGGLLGSPGRCPGNQGTGKRKGSISRAARRSPDVEELVGLQSRQRITSAERLCTGRGEGLQTEEQSGAEAATPARVGSSVLWGLVPASPRPAQHLLRRAGTGSTSGGLHGAPFLLLHLQAPGPQKGGVRPAL